MAIMYEFESGINIVDRVDVIDEGEKKKNLNKQRFLEIQ